MMRLSRYGGNPNLGVFAVTNESLCIVAADASPEFVNTLEGTLGVETLMATVAGSFVVGSLVAMNSNGAVVSGLSDPFEVKRIEEHIPCTVLSDSQNAAGNNILVNDKGAIVNPQYGPETVKSISDALGVECVSSPIAGCNTPGSVCAVTNKGCICHLDASEEELALISDVMGVEVVKTSINHGSRIVGAGLVANSKGAVIGDDTTPIEMGRIEEGLGLY